MVDKGRGRRKRLFKGNKRGIRILNEREKGNVIVAPNKIYSSSFGFCPQLRYQQSAVLCSLHSVLQASKKRL